MMKSLTLENESSRVVSVQACLFLSNIKVERETEENSNWTWTWQLLTRMCVSLMNFAIWMDTFIKLKVLTHFRECRILVISVFLFLYEWRYSSSLSQTSGIIMWMHVIISTWFLHHRQNNDSISFLATLLGSLYLKRTTNSDIATSFKEGNRTKNIFTAPYIIKNKCGSNTFRALMTWMHECPLKINTSFFCVDINFFVGRARSLKMVCWKAKILKC